MKKNKPYKLRIIAAEVQRLNLVDNSWPEDIKVGQPSQQFINKRIEQLYGTSYQ